MISAYDKRLIGAFCAARTRRSTVSPSYTSSDAARGYLPGVAGGHGLRTAVPVYLDDILVGRVADNLAMAVAELNQAMSNLFSRLQTDTEASEHHAFYDPTPDDAGTTQHP